MAQTAFNWWLDTKNLTPLLDEMPEFQGQEKPKWRTVAGWHADYIKAEEDIHALIPKHHRKGNRQARTETDKLFELALMRYLIREIPSVASAYSELFNSSFRKLSICIIYLYE